ncbi:receptor-type tyrosine-protein phosphatase U isoform X1 [Tachysurus ichikawai]
MVCCLESDLHVKIRGTQVPARDSGCTFEEDSNADLCEYRQEQDDDFDWQLVRTSSWPSVPSDLTWGEFYRMSLFQSCHLFPTMHLYVRGIWCSRIQ